MIQTRYFEVAIVGEAIQKTGSISIQLTLIKQTVEENTKNNDEK